MKRDIKSATNATELRSQAEETVNACPAVSGMVSGNLDANQLVHELQVHQIELEMQNMELRQTKEELETLLEKFTDVYDFSPVSYFTLDRNGVIKGVNLTGAALFNRERTRLLGLRFGLFVSVHNRPAFTDFLEKVFTSLVKESCEVVLKLGEDAGRFVLIEGMATVSGLDCRIAVIDITERKIKENALLESEKKCRVIFDQSLDAVFFTEPGGLIFDANPAACTLFGFTVQEFCRMGRAGVMDLNDPRLAPALEERKRTGRLHTELNCIRKSGEKFPAEVSSVIVSDKPSRSFVIIRDITKRKQAEDDLRLFTRRLIEMEEDLRKTLATELHDEICGELTALGINFSLMRNSLHKKASGELKERIVDSEKLVDSVRRTTRSIMGSLRPTGLDDLDLVAALSHHIDSFSQRTGITVSLEVADDLPRLSPAQEIVLFRIVQESLTNISKHADARGVNITLHKEDRLIRLSISDDGRGFTPLTMSGVTAGNGMGLRTMRKRAEMIGGTFHLESIPGIGTTVAVQIEETEHAD